MPCNGVTVASARVSLEEQKYLGLAGQAVIDQVVKAYLSNLGYTAAGEDGYYTVRSSQTGLFWVSVANGTAGVANGPIGLENQIKALLSGLAGKMRQTVILKKIVDAGVKVTSNQVASNGGLVLEVEI